MIDESGWVGWANQCQPQIIKQLSHQMEHGLFMQNGQAWLIRTHASSVEITAWFLSPNIGHQTGSYDSGPCGP